MATRRLVELGALTKDGKATGTKILLTASIEDELDALGVKSGILYDLADCGVVERASFAA
jgi:hypothetical protein